MEETAVAGAAALAVMAGVAVMAPGSATAAAERAGGCG